MQSMKQGTVYTDKDENQQYRVTSLLDAAGLDKKIVDQPVILIKPNLVEALPPPITTPVSLVKNIILYLRKHSQAEILIGEGTASATYDTHHAFEALGYSKLGKDLGVSLIDLNHEPCVSLRCTKCVRWPEMHLPQIAMKSFLLSVPVLKAHSLAQVTLTMKNMMGLAPPQHYQQGGGWKKSAFHLGIQEAVADLNRYRTPDFSLLDATLGMAEAHLWGPTCQPPPHILAASEDPVAIDAYGAQLLHKNWQDIGHIKSVHHELGQAAPLTVHEIKAAK